MPIPPVSIATVADTAKIRNKHEHTEIYTNYQSLAIVCVRARCLHRNKIRVESEILGVVPIATRILKIYVNKPRPCNYIPIKHVYPPSISLMTVLMMALLTLFLLLNVCFPLWEKDFDLDIWHQYPNLAPNELRTFELRTRTTNYEQQVTHTQTTKKRIQTTTLI